MVFFREMTAEEYTEKTDFFLQPASDVLSIFFLIKQNGIFIPVVRFSSVGSEMQPALGETQDCVEGREESPHF